MNISGWQKLLILVSVVSVGIALYLADYLVIPTIVSPLALVASLVCLFLGFYAWCLSWHALLNASNFPVSIATSVAGTGLSVFGKYIPGKLWSIVGRAAYVARRHSYPLGILSAFSLKAQLIDLWTGLLLGTLCLVSGGSDDLRKWGLVPALAWIALTIILFFKSPRQLVDRLAQRILKKNLEIERLGSAANTPGATLWSLTTWVFLAVGFHLFALALVNRGFHWTVGLTFPLAGTLGIMAFVVPGGIGVREGLLTGLLTMSGLTLAEAAGVAIASRLWYLIGEVFVFLIGIAASWTSARETAAPMEIDR